MAKKASAKTRARKTPTKKNHARTKTRPKLARSPTPTRSKPKPKPRPKPSRKASYRLQKPKTYYRAKDLNDKVTRLKPTKGAKMDATSHNVEKLLMRVAEKAKFSKKPTVRFGARVMVRYRRNNKTYKKTISAYAESYQEAMAEVLNDGTIKNRRYEDKDGNSYDIEKGLKIYNASFVQIVKENNDFKVSNSRKKKTKRKTKNRKLRRRK